MFLVFNMPGNSLLQAGILRHPMILVPSLIYFHMNLVSGKKNASLRKNFAALSIAKGKNTIHKAPK
jgi:hypothetical protein